LLSPLNTMVRAMFPVCCSLKHTRGHCKLQSRKISGTQHWYQSFASQRQEILVKYLKSFLLQAICGDRLTFESSHLNREAVKPPSCYEDLQSSRSTSTFFAPNALEKIQFRHIILLYPEEQAAQHSGFRRNALVLAYVNVGILTPEFHVSSLHR
jgi:hypothetical protein